MIITPARFENALNNINTPEAAVNVMLEILDSLGYSVGVKLYKDKFLREEKQ